ncbi:hypothetical protein [Sphingobacterium multivorum]|uniref:hypothetical protein n=1 Tax=Sphingobacterium multivorum TaxID=28454 RepID=UPI0031BB0483
MKGILRLLLLKSSQILEQFAARRDVKRILDFLKEETAVNLLKLHHDSKRFSGDYWLDVVVLK